MEREDLLRSKEFWMVEVQNDLYGIMDDYMKKNNLNRVKLAEKLGVSKGYITQIFKGDFDHKISKLIELALASEKVPLIKFVDIKEYITNDANEKIYELFPVMRPQGVTFEVAASKVNAAYNSTQSIGSSSDSIKSPAKPLVSASPSFKEHLINDLIPRIEAMAKKEKEHLHWLVDHDAPMDFIQLSQKYYKHFTQRIKEYQEYAERL
jgi:transcriptional regulator with XRE-family HTH domain